MRTSADGSAPAETLAVRRAQRLSEDLSTVDILQGHAQIFAPSIDVDLAKELQARAGR